MVRVLHVVSYFPPDRVGGVGQVVAHLHRELLARGHESKVLTTGVSNNDLLVRRISRSPATFAFASARHVALARNADVVHIHHGEGIGLLSAMRLRGIRTPVLLTLHVDVSAMRRSLGPYRVGTRAFRPESLRSWMYRQGTMRVRSGLDLIAVELSDRVSFISRSAATDVLGLEAGAQATVVYNGIPPAEMETSATLRAVDLLFVGVNTERKRVELLPLILAEVRKRRPDARLRIVGFGRDDNPEVIAIARQCGVLDAIEFSGVCRPGDLGRHYRSSRVLLVPSAYEGLPMVILEAMQYGLPVIATEVSGHPEVIENGVSGMLVPLDDPAAMAIAALCVLEDESTAERVSNAGRAVARTRFSIEQQVGAYLAEYESLIRAKGRIP